MMTRAPTFRPFVERGRRAIAAILLTITLVSALSVGLSIWSTTRSQHQAAVVEVAARQRTLAERYVEEILLVRAGERADPASIASALRRSARALLHGEVAPGLAGDDDETRVARQTGSLARRQLEQASRLVTDLTAAGGALLAHRPVDAVPQTAREHLPVGDSIDRLRVLAALTSNVSLNAARTIARADDSNINHLIVLQVALGLGGLLISLLLAWALIAATRRQTAHFRSLVTASTDLVFVFGAGGCRYVSHSVLRMTGGSEEQLFATRVFDVIHEDDRVAVQSAARDGEPHEIVFRLRTRFGEWRHLEAHVTDLRSDRLIGGVVLNARDVTERLHLERQLTHQAFHDGLTDLPNRALFRDRLEHALARGRRSHETLSVLLIDLDGFKQVNDSLGHDAGDQLLGEVASRFATVVRGSDTVARLGGDEFAVLLEGVDERQTLAVATRLLDCLDEPVTIAGRALGLRASIGVVVDAGCLCGGDELIRNADIAMYAAKEGGRGRYELFHQNMTRELGELLGIEHELRLALQRGEFTLHYQPLVDLARDGVIIGAEALLRWRSPTRGIVAPDRFIPVAETTGLILPLGEYVLHEACAQTAQWRNEASLPDSFVTWVNVSAKQLSVGGITATVGQALAAAGLLPHHLGLEITESMLVESGVAAERARAELIELHGMGVRIAIDDFGTGFSSLGQLRNFPIDMIKVDRSFIHGSERDARDATITSNLISLAHALDLVAVAEGIESKAQLQTLRELGCDHAQGFLFARPGPAQEISDLLARTAVGSAGDAANAVA
jgi:diguanylate cyclase (GGDEF)-like protein/PAS domain S-box-containing protein